MIKIAPSILSADFANMGDAVHRMQSYGADYIHCDVMDGIFVPAITFGPQMIRDIKKHTTLPLDVHLMIERPERYAEEFAASGADIITVHAEATQHLHRALQQIRMCGVRAGAELNPATPCEQLEYVLEACDMILLMSVNPGFGGQKFIQAVLPKIDAMANRIARSGLSIELEVDGGVTVKNAAALRDAGATVLVAGSAVFNSEDPAMTIPGSLRG